MVNKNIVFFFILFCIFFVRQAMQKDDLDELAYKQGSDPSHSIFQDKVKAKQDLEALYDLQNPEQEMNHLQDHSLPEAEDSPHEDRHGHHDDSKKILDELVAKLSETESMSTEDVEMIRAKIYAYKEIYGHEIKARDRLPMEDLMVMRLKEIDIDDYLKLSDAQKHQFYIELGGREWLAQSFVKVEYQAKEFIPATDEQIKKAKLNDLDYGADDPFSD